MSINLVIASMTNPARKGTAMREVHEMLNRFVAENDVSIEQMANILEVYIDGMRKLTRATPQKFYDDEVEKAAAEAAAKN